MKHSSLLTVPVVILLATFATLHVHAQNLDSGSYTILDATVDNGGGTVTGTNYDGIISIGNPTADARLTSGSYELKSGFPNGLLANVPLLNCFETDTTSGNTDCTYFPNANGAQGECGTPGCYDRAKLEIDDAGNPVDAVYLVRIEDLTNAVTYYLQSDHTLDTGYDLNDFMTQCELEGIDPDDTTCDDSGDGAWSESLQSANILGLTPDTTFEVSVSALSGDFTGTRFSEALTETTLSPTISFDIDVASTDTESSAPYELEIGELIYVAVTTAADTIWLDLGTNAVNGANVYVRDTAGQLESTLTGETVPSESEDLASDPNNNGGYGIKIASTTQSTLGPLQTSATYDTAGAHEVGALSGTNALLVYTDTTGGNLGPVSGGRAGISVKARSAVTDIAAGDLTDDITFICVGNF
ncbi:MAG: hypothetical protein TR69_WS6001000560 [candidate division WS6 bacterium OLB20]|uniref:Fibronectin type-III domain-containing protein n=1 Tax=candidate division WS6 bacterium OLB20 TaxID=1617426 RepID=A0A136LY11_9BACT|nr:MAG: hypothetical protein TR69_WS6001000560 [candidate division WS6 bacterium OLB20]